MSQPSEKGTIGLINRLSPACDTDIETVILLVLPELWGEADVVVGIGERLMMQQQSWGLDDDLAASPRQRTRDRETGHTGADDEAFDCVHGSLQRVGAATLSNPPAPPVRPAPCRRPT